MILPVDFFMRGQPLARVPAVATYGNIATDFFVPLFASLRVGALVVEVDDAVGCVEG